MVVVCDRPVAAVRVVTARLGLSLPNVRSLSDFLATDPDVFTHTDGLELLTCLAAQVRVAFIIGFRHLYVGLDEVGMVSRFLAPCAKLCAERDLTVIATLPTAKVVKAQRTLNPRERPYGSVAWGHQAESVMVLEPVHPSQATDPYRRLYVYVSNLPGRCYDFVTDSIGALKLCVPDQPVRLLEPPQLKGQKQLDAFLAGLPSGESFKTRDLRALASKASISRWVRRKLEEGGIQGSRGLYQKRCMA